MRERIEDGFGNAWSKCDRADCSLQIVRPGKTQCDDILVEGEFGREWVQPCAWDDEVRESQPNHVTQNGSAGRAETGVATDGSAEGRPSVAQADSPSSRETSSGRADRHAGNVKHFADVLDDRLQDDIVTRLRASDYCDDDSRCDTCMLHDEAADEIERLRREATAFAVGPEDRLVIVAPEGTDRQVCEHIKHSTGISDRVIVIAKPMEARRG